MRSKGRIPTELKGCRYFVSVNRYEHKKEVEKAIGKSIADPSKLTEEDFKKVPPVPQKLQEVVQFMMSGKQ